MITLMVVSNAVTAINWVPLIIVQLPSINGVLQKYISCD